MDSILIATGPQAIVDSAVDGRNGARSANPRNPLARFNSIGE